MTDQATSDKPVVLLRPAPQRIERIFSPDALRRLNERYTVIDGEADPSEEAIEACLPEVFAIIGQPDLPAERLERAPKLRGILNVEGNFFQNVDYETAFSRGINVAVCAPVYAQAVAEHALGLAIDLARGISREDRAFREGRERWVSAGNQDAILLRGAEMGILGYGNIGRRLLPLLVPFRPARHPLLRPVAARCRHPGRGHGAGLARGDPVDEHVPLHPGHRDRGVHPPARTRTIWASSRRAPGSSCRAAPPWSTSMPSSRAVAAGRFLCATDVWPEEPAAPDHPARRLEGMVLSAHRAGGIPAAFHEIGEMVLDDLDLMARGLPPVRNQLASRELVTRYRSRPVR